MDNDDYLWSQDLRDWDKRQDYYERLEIDPYNDVSDEWKDERPPEIQKLIDWYKENES